MSAWGGTMWWCCGKKDINQPGCKFQKHIDKNDENGRGDGDDEDDNNNGQGNNVRCLCCKAVGHTIKQCERDPNFKTNV